MLQTKIKKSSRRRLCASLQSRNGHGHGHGHVTGTILCEYSLGRCRASRTNVATKLQYETRTIVKHLNHTTHTKKKHCTTVCQKKMLNKGRCWFHFFPSHPQVSQTGKNISASNLHETGKMGARLDMIRMAKTNLRSLGSRSVSFFKTEQLEKL
jgi:hypothetical protein